jgi:hypothetical protein
MTRKDYEKLAAALGRAMGKERKASGKALSAGFLRAYEEITEVLAADNPRYDRARFFAAMVAEDKKY